MIIRRTCYYEEEEIFAVKKRLPRQAINCTENSYCSILCLCLIYDEPFYGTGMNYLV